MYWIDKLLPGCCTNRNYQSKSELKKVKAYIPEIQITPQVDFSQIMPELENFEEEKKTPITQNIQKLPPKDITESRRSTNFTEASLESFKNPQILLKCDNCKTEAKGYCPACPSKRFCSQCFSEIHQTPSELHQFIKYRTKTEVSKQDYKKLIKIKSLM